MQIFLARNNIQAGPYTLDELNQMLSAGDVELTDLMWHEGMANWQTVGQVTGNAFIYNPNIITRIPVQTPEPATPTESPNDKSASWLTKLPVKKPAGIDVAHAKKQLELASIGSRILAKLIDIGLFVLAILPLYFSLANNPNFAKIMTAASAGISPAENRQLIMNLLTEMPMSMVSLTYLMIFAILIAQILLLVKRGQSIGKMAMGIRILDVQSNAIPSFLSIILLRSIAIIILFVVSNLSFLDANMVRLFSAGIQFFFLADLITMFINPKKQSLHDKIANTYVVRADDTQTTPLALEPDA